MTAEITPIRLKNVENAQGDLPAPSDDLSPRTQRLWADLVADWDLTSDQLALLEEACRSLDRADEARVIVDTEGAVVWDRFRQAKAHPMIGVERDMRSLFARTIREIGIDSSALDSRPPRIANRYDE